jgi:2-polyprenyl-3-methyl-5-hydroxy-6-metoxy-1,4-benzoquinol methylase
MIIHKLIQQHLRHRDDEKFYLLQAEDAIKWLECSGIVLNSNTCVLDLGCGHGVFGAALAKRGCQVTFADEFDGLLPELAGSRFLQVNIDKDSLSRLGSYDVVICSNVYEHLSRPDQFLRSVSDILKPGGTLFLSWTNWLSIWGGHEFSPFHYLGTRRGHLIYDKITKRHRKHTPYENLFPTYIGQTMKIIRTMPKLRIVKTAPRYYTELAFLMHLPVLREFLAWNCAMIIQRKS